MQLKVIVFELFKQNSSDFYELKLLSRQQLRLIVKISHCCAYVTFYFDYKVIDDDGWTTN